MGLWRELERHPPEFFGLPPAPPSLLADSWFEWFAILYRRCALTFGWTPRVVDDLELWEVASALGDGTREWEEWNEEYARLEREYENVDGDIPGAPATNVKWGQDILAQRVAYAQGEGPAPEARVMGQLEAAELMRRLNGN